MIVVDTNVWARAFLGDHPQQSSRARQALAAARSKEGVFVPLVVMAELSWVLRSARWERERILKTLESLLHTHGVTPEAPQVVQSAIDAARKGGTAFRPLDWPFIRDGCAGSWTWTMSTTRSTSIFSEADLA